MLLDALPKSAYPVSVLISIHDATKILNSTRDGKNGVFQLDTHIPLFCFSREDIAKTEKPTYLFILFLFFDTQSGFFGSEYHTYFSACLNILSRCSFTSCIYLS